MESEDNPNLGVSSDEGLHSDTLDSFLEEQRSDFSSPSSEGSIGNSYSDCVSQSVDFDGDTDISGWVVDHSKYPEPYFLKGILRDELGKDGRYNGHRLIVVAVHAVMLESGFVGIDPVTGMRVDRFCLSNQWPSKAFTLSLRYSLPELVAGGGNMPDCVSLRFSRCGHFMEVYAPLAKGKSKFYMISLDEHRFGPVLDLMWEKDEKNAEKKGTHGTSCSYPEKEVFEFWKIVKEDLVLPLLTDLTERLGLPLPSRFMCLPVELKLKIFESLAGVDLARVGCVSSELRSLADNNDLWERKFANEYREPVGVQGSVNWKQRFARTWEAETNWLFSWGAYLWDMQPRYPFRDAWEALPRVHHWSLSPSREDLGQGVLMDHARYWNFNWRDLWEDVPVGYRWYRSPNREDEEPVLRGFRTLDLHSRRRRPNIWERTEEPRVNAGPNRPSCGLDSRGAMDRRAPKNISTARTRHGPKNCFYRRKGKHR